MFGSLIIHSNPWRLFDEESGRRKHSRDPDGHRAMYVMIAAPYGLHVKEAVLFSFVYVYNMLFTW